MAQFYFFRPFISDKTDLESTHSSNMSGLPEKQIIPPDALYTSNEKMMNMKNSGYISYEHVFNDSKVRITTLQRGWENETKCILIPSLKTLYFILLLVMDFSVTQSS